MVWENKELEHSKLELRMRLHIDLQSVLLDDVLDEMHPALIQMTLVKFLRAATKKKNDPRIDLDYVRRLLDELRLR